MDPTLEALTELFDRDLERLKDKINTYPREHQLWDKQGQVNNPPGNLCLHLEGNLRHYIGHLLGGYDYQRDREREFEARDVPRKELLQGIDQTKVVVNNTLQEFPAEKLETPFPVEVFGHPMSTRFFLIHLAGHLNYHLGQVDYHFRHTT